MVQCCRSVCFVFLFSAEAEICVINYNITRSPIFVCFYIKNSFNLDDGILYRSPIWILAPGTSTLAWKLKLEFNILPNSIKEYDSISHLSHKLYHTNKLRQPLEIAQQTRCSSK